MIETKNPSKLLNASAVFMIETIRIRSRRRPVKEAAVASLMESIRECGLVNPITVATKKNGNVILVAGLHRLEACKRLGWKSIPAQTLHSSVDMLTELAEIDENLVRNELTPLEMADALKRRKEIYEKLHPATKHGGDHTSEAGKQVADSATCYAKDTALKTGNSERLVRENVKLATDLAKATKDKIRDTSIAGSKEELKALASVPKQQQARIVDQVLSGKAPSVRSVVEPKKPELIAVPPAAPIAQTLKEKYNGNVSETIPPKPKPVPCKDHRIGLFTCPDGKSHFSTEKIRGRVCDILSAPLNQLPGDECPLERNSRQFPQAITKPGLLDPGDTAFNRASSPPLPKTQTSWGLARTLTREEKMHTLCIQILIPKQVQVLRMLMKAGEADDELMSLDTIIDWAQERMEGA